MEFVTPENRRHQKAKKANPKKRKAEKLRKLKQNSKTKKKIPQKFFFIPLDISQKTKWKLRFFPMSSVKAIQELEKINTHKVFTFQETNESKKELEESVKKILDVRWKLRRLIIFWKYKKCKPANDVDPITMENILEPIKLYNISLKIYYQFEAKTLSEYWRISLRESDGLIPTPKWPRNPLTNLPICRKTLDTICDQLLQKGYTDSYLTSLAETKFNILLWKSIYQIPLRLNAVKNTFQNTNSRDCMDYTYDYIELQCQIHQIQFSKPFFDWIFYKNKNKVIQEKADNISKLWIKYCKDFYEKEILNPERSELTKELAKIHPIIKNLFKMTYTLQRFYQEYIVSRNVRITPTQSP